LGEGDEDVATPTRSFPTGAVSRCAPLMQGVLRDLAHSPPSIRFRTSMAPGPSSEPPVPPVLKPTGFVGRFGAYFAGGLIVLVGVSWAVAVPYSSIPEIRPMVAVVLGPILAIPAAGAHFGLQVLARWMLRKVWVLRPIPEMAILNLPATVAVGLLLAMAYGSMSAQSVFEKFVARPMPASVRVLGHGGGKINFAEGDQRAIRFEIGAEDLSAMVRHGEFSSVASERTADEWQRLILHSSRLDLDFPTPHLVYRRQLPPFQPDDVEEFLLCWSNRPVVVFVRLDR
jgi:hypothetical protein